jgi:PncC family amidohydrolase
MHEESVGKRLNFSDFLESEQQIDSSAELAQFLTRHELTVSVIESVTGGGIARQLIGIPGASAFFAGGIVAYQSRLKVQLGGVNPKTMATHGEVSASVTEEMAAGILKLTKSDMAIASNGIASPNHRYSPEQSGTVFLSWNIHDKLIKTKRYQLDGGRNNVIDSAVFIALTMGLRYLKNDSRKDN